MLQATANWLLEADPRQVQQQQRAWEQEAQRLEQQRQQTELLKQKQKKLIVEKWVADLVTRSLYGHASSIQGVGLRRAAYLTLKQPYLSTAAVLTQYHWCVSVCVCRFDLRVVSDSSSSSSKPGAKRVQGPDLLPKVQHESKLRYRDGKVVSTKGERIIVEKVGEDWDGGSRCVLCEKTCLRFAGLGRALGD